MIILVKKVKLVFILLVLAYTNLSASDLQVFEAGKKAFSVGLYSIALDNLTTFLEERDGNDKEDDAVYLSGISSYYLKKYNKSLTYLEALELDYKDSPYVEKSYYWIGLNYYNLNEYSSAIIWFQRDKQSKSKFSDVSALYKALSYLQLDRGDEAKKALLEVINNKEASPKYTEEALYRLASLYLEEGSANRAINYFNKIVLDYSESKYYLESLSLLGESYFLLDEWDNARRSYLLLLDVGGSDRDRIYKRLATIYYKLDDINSSKEYLERYVGEYGEDISVLTMLSEILVKTGDNKRAIEVLSLLEKSGLSQDQRIKNSYTLGTIYFKDKKYRRAYELFSKLSSKEALYFSTLSGIYSDLDIMPSINRLVDNFYSDKYTLDAINRYINYLEKGGNSRELEKLLLYVVNKYPENISYSLTLGEYLLEHGRFDESLKYLSRGYSRDSKYYSNISYKIGWIYYNKGEFSRAIKFFNSLKEGDDDYLKALYSKSIAYYQIGDLNSGKRGFLELLKKESIYKSEVAFYLGMIEKDNHNYKKAITYFYSSKSKDSLYKDSMDNIAWCHYHQKEYNRALKIYLNLSKKSSDTIYKFNAANCYFYLEDYNSALSLYEVVSNSNNKLRGSAYYKVIEILFYLGEDDRGYDYVKKFYKDLPESELPFEVIINIGDNRLYNGDPDGALKIYKKITSIFNRGKNWDRARFRQAEAYRVKGDFETSSDIYMSSITTGDYYFKESIKELVNLLSEVSDPELTSTIISKLNSKVKDRSTIIPLYIEEVRQTIFRVEVLDYIDELISLSKNRKEIDTLIYLKGLHHYTLDDIVKASSTIKPLLARAEVSSETKIEALLLQGDIYEKRGKSKDAIDLYLKLYLNFSKNRERASYALYKGLMITKEIEDNDLYKKIYNILKKEYKDTIWGKRGISDKK